MADPAFLLKVRMNEAQYATLAGLFLIDGSLESGKLTGRGVFCSNVAKRHVDICYANAEPEPFELSFADGARFRGNFIIEDVRDAGVVVGEHRYDIDLALVGIAQAVVDLTDSLATKSFK